MERFPCPGNHDLPQSLCVAFFQSPYEYLTRSCTATLKPPRAKIGSKPLLPPLHSEAATQKVPDDSLPSIMILYYLTLNSRWCCHAGILPSMRLLVHCSQFGQGEAAWRVSAYRAGFHCVSFTTLRTGQDFALPRIQCLYGIATQQLSNQDCPSLLPQLPSIACPVGLSVQYKDSQYLSALFPFTVRVISLLNYRRPSHPLSFLRAHIP